MYSETEEFSSQESLSQSQSYKPQSSSSSSIDHSQVGVAGHKMNVIMSLIPGFTILIFGRWEWFPP